MLIDFKQVAKGDEGSCLIPCLTQFPECVSTTTDCGIGEEAPCEVLIQTECNAWIFHKIPGDHIVDCVMAVPGRGGAGCPAHPELERGPQ